MTNVTVIGDISGPGSGAAGLSFASMALSFGIGWSVQQYPPQLLVVSSGAAFVRRTHAPCPDTGLQILASLEQAVRAFSAHKRRLLDVHAAKLRVAHDFPR